MVEYDNWRIKKLIKIKLMSEKDMSHRPSSFLRANLLIAVTGGAWCAGAGVDCSADMGWVIAINQDAPLVGCAAPVLEA